MNRNKEYVDKLVDIFNNGGVLYLVERTDINHFLSISLQPFDSKNLGRNNYIWANRVELSEILLGYLTKEDAESDFHNYSEGGCSCCGHGSIKIPITITEHEFVKQNQ